MTRWTSLIGMAIAFVVASPVWASDVFTPTLEAGSNTSSSLDCSVLVTSGSASNVTVSIHTAGAGAVHATTTFSSIPAGAARSTIDAALPGSGEFYCKVSGASKTRIKVTLCALNAGGNCTVAVTAP